jgi:hypothetical protein
VDSATQVARIIKLVEKWRVPTKLVYILEYKYLDVGLAFKNLRNRDRAVGEILKRARIESQLAFELYLCLIKVCKPKHTHTHIAREGESERERETTC